MVGATASALMGVMDPVLIKLSDLLERDYGRLKGVHRGIASLRDEMSSMKAVLVDLSQLDEPGLQQKDWMCQLRELSYDIEDCVDVFVHQLGRADDVSDGIIGKLACWFDKLKVCRRAAGQVAELKERAVEISDRRKRLKIDVSTPRSSAVAIDPRLPALFEEASRLVSIEGPRDELVKWLMEDSSSAHQRKVVSIVGLGGVGKTTLANQVYLTIKDQFDSTAFVSVSRNPNLRKILTDIFSGVRGGSNPTSDDQKLDDKQFIDRIRDHLKDRRYLIVIDDIWSTPAWNIIQCVFCENKLASRIMTTTRIRSVAKTCCFSHEDWVYDMKPLDKDDSRRLFFKRVFGHEDGHSLELKTVANKILKKCGGLPLVIINIASLLANRPVTKQEWERVRNSIGSTLEQGQELEAVKKILFLSYCDLPHHLKICFLYLSLFPEDFVIDRRCLIWRWIAEGFITEQGGQSLEEVGENYFNELVNRNMIQPVDMNYGGIARACRVHDIMLDLIISLSAEENFVTILHDQQFRSSLNNIRRLSIQYNSEEEAIWLGTKSFSHVRSFTIFNRTEIPPLLDFLVLRVLDIGRPYFGCEHIPIEDIESLFQLRYLSLKGNWKIPKQIGKLQLLQTLNLRRTAMKELPATVVELRQLLRLLIPPGVKLPNGIGNMEALQELSFFDGCINSEDILLELGNLINLKVLAIAFGNNRAVGLRGRSYQKSLVSSLCKLGECSLRSLHIFHQCFHYLSLDFLVDSWCPPPRRLQEFVIAGRIYFPRFPKWFSSLSELTHLCINLKQLRVNDLQMLKNLPALLSFEICTEETPQETFTISYGEFQCLRQFAILPLDGMRFKGKRVRLDLMFEAGAMPKLQKLIFSFNAHDKLSAYGGFDFGIQHLTSLRYLTVQIICTDAIGLVTIAEESIRNAADILPNHPKLEIEYWQWLRLEERLEDGYRWVKYGQKTMHFGKHPRSYYRCKYRHSQGCQAKKQVQRTDDDPAFFWVRYFGKHTCVQEAARVAESSRTESTVHSRVEPHSED